ncbi:MAG TPA: hypothetical protein VKR83_15970 [Ktedonobacteraceae bacterium]|nr:hypothetical protein [Ktedonobacteraceae bacterium]
MALIRVQERSEKSGRFQAIVSFNNGPEHRITIKDPFAEKEEKELEWYFEEHLSTINECLRLWSR